MVVAGAAVLLSAWLVANVVVQAPAGWLGSEIQGSDVLRAVDTVMPPVPTVFANVQSFLATPGFPSVFAQLAPTTAGPVAVPSQGAAAAMAASTPLGRQGVGAGLRLPAGGIGVRGGPRAWW